MEPKDFFRVILRRRRTVITALVVVVGVAIFGSMRLEPTYAAACKVRIAAVGPGGTGGQISEDPKKNPTEIYASFEEMTQILQSPVMAGAVAIRLKAPYGDVAGKINAQHEQNTGLFNLTALSNRAVFAAHLCNAYMDEFLAQRVSLATQRVSQVKAVEESKIQKYQEALEENNVKIANAKDIIEQNNLRLKAQHVLADIADIEKNIRDLDSALEIGLAGGGDVVERAGDSGLKVGPDHKRNAILGLIVGLIFGAILALTREYMDDTVRDKEAAQRDIGLPVLASMPSGRDADPFGDGAFESIEAARMLRTNLASRGLGGDLRCIVVTSTLAKRRSETLSALASAIAEAGRTVLVIGADFRHARIHETFGVGNNVGLTNVIRGQVTFDKAIRPVPGQVGVYVMPSGPVIGNPGELLSTEEMAMVIRRARKWADIVLIDAPPVLAAADASVLGTYADGVLLVMSAGQTLRAQANEAKEQLAAAGARLLGAVMFGASDAGASGGKVLALSGMRRGGGDDDLPPLNPYGGFDGGYDTGGFDGGYGSFGAGSYGNGGFGASLGEYGSYGDPYAGYEDEVYDVEDAVAVKPRARSPKANGDDEPKPKRKKGPPKKIVAARPSARELRQDRESTKAPKRTAGRPVKEPARGNGRSAANGRGGSRSNGSASPRRSATPAPRARSTGKGSANGTKKPTASPPRSRRNDDLF